MCHAPFFPNSIYWHTLGKELGNRIERGLVVELPWGAGIFKWGVLQRVCILNLKCDMFHLAL